jgi:septum formation protein
MRLILASASPRRSELLTAAGFRFEMLPVDVDERVRINEAPDDYVRRLASEKSARALERLQTPAVRGNSGNQIVTLGADTAVIVDSQILGKPDGAGDARRMLRLLSGRSHQVVTAVSVRTDDVERTGLETTEVWVSDLTPADLDWYVATGEGADKAGAYAIQGLASRFIPRIEGSYSNVVGLPVAMAARVLREFGIS